MTDQNAFYFSPEGLPPLPVVVWGTGTMGRAGDDVDAALAGAAAASPGIYDALDVPLSPAVGRLGRGPTSTAVATSITSVSTRKAGS